jgi:hypothetical protein
MTELERSLTADSAFAPPSHILEGISAELAHRLHLGAPHTIYAELWHIAFWLRMSLDWCTGIETPIPPHAAAGFPTPAQTEAEPWPALRARFLAELPQAAALTRDPELLKTSVRCPSLPGVPTRTMTVEDQLISLAAHNAYHLGRIVLLRQMAGAWPPASGGFTW